MLALIDIAPEFIFIESKGFVIRKLEHNPESFGDALIEMAGKPFSLQFVRDRDQVFVNVGNHNSGWNKLEYVLEFVNSSVTQQQIGEPPNVVIMSNIFQENWKSVESLFLDQAKILRLKEFVTNKSNIFIEKIFGRC